MITILPSSIAPTTVSILKVAFPPPPVIVRSSPCLYPVPVAAILTAVTSPATTVVLTVQSVLPLPPLVATLVPAVYPLPPAVIVTYPSPAPPVVTV